MIMKQIFIKSLFTFGLIWFMMQNPIAQDCLVPNGDFEEFDECPDGVTSSTTNPFPAKFWTFVPNHTATSDYYNACDDGEAGVPNNLQGSQNARSGVGYAGFISRTSNSGYSEYIMVELTEPLSQGVFYEASMWISLSEDRFEDFGGGPARKIGMYLSPEPIGLGSSSSIIWWINPQVEQSGIIEETEQWHEISGIVQGNGQKFLTIGLFDSTVPSENVYVYIDDVCVKTCDKQPPQVSGVNGSPDYIYDALPGEEFCFTFNTSDPDGDMVSIIGSDLSNVPGASLTPTGGMSPAGTFCWTAPTVASGTYTFTVTVEDDGADPPLCLNNEQATFTFTIQIDCQDCYSAVYYEDRNLLSSGSMNPLPEVTVSSSFIKAGYDVTPYLENGPVIVHDGQDVRFYYTTQTVLDAGFSVEPGGYLLVEPNNLCVPECIVPDVTASISLLETCNGYTIQVEAEGGTENYPYYGWSDGSVGQTITVYPSSETDYTVTVSDDLGNTGTAVITLEATPPSGMYQGNLAYAMPNAFTPNGDGLNDFFRPVSLAPFDVAYAYNAFRYDFKIFGSWGGVLYQVSNDIRNTPTYASPGFNPNEIGWDGTVNGSPMPSYTYVYLLELENCDHNILISGDVSLLRKKDDSKPETKPTTKPIPNNSSMEVFPNPFSGNAKISLDISEEENITINLMDSRGKIVRNVFENRILEPGSYEFDLNGSDLSSGIYYCHLYGKNTSIVKKVTILK